MSRQIPLIGYIGDIKQDGGYDVTVKTADGITVGKYEMDSQGQPIEKDYVEQAKSASKVYVTNAQGKDSTKPLGDFAMAGDIPSATHGHLIMVDCDLGYSDVEDMTVTGGLLTIMASGNNKYGMIYINPGYDASFNLTFSSPEDWSVGGDLEALGLTLTIERDEHGDPTSYVISGTLPDNLPGGVYGIHFTK